ncbi:MAG: hypothetical protein KC996_09735 [Phycisphaerales bacterium]|nr:hypothetical protein [Phycisphaerales bacterium]
MRQHIRIAMIIAATGACAPALAQDSVSIFGGDLPGDALGPWDQQCEAFVLDLSPVISTQGYVFGVGPILKTERYDAAFFNNLPSTSAISPDVVLNVPFSRSTYSFWDTPGSGIHGELNNPGQPVMPTGESSRFAVVQGNFGGAVGNNYNGIVGAIVNFDPAAANRLYVDRYQVALNRLDDVNPPSSALGGYSLDANGNVYYRGDGNGTTGAADALTGSNWYRTRMNDRDCQNVNFISNSGALSDATDRLVTNSTTLHPAPNMIPASIAGGNGLIAGVNFNTEYLYGASAPLSVETAYVDTTGGIGSGVRGKLGSTSFDFLNVGAAHSFSQIAKGTGGNSTVANIHAVDASGNLLAKQGFEFPIGTPIVDNDDGFAITYTSAAQYYTYTGAATFQGVGHIALGHDQQDRGLMAGTVMVNGTNDDFANQIVVGRYDANTGLTEWTLAAWVDQFGLGTMNEGKAIYDSSGNEIGQLVTLLNLNGTFGPMMSSPAMDSVGNIWFMGAVELYDRLAPGVSDFDGALLRAIYNPATFSYNLEMVLEVGQQIDGLNSGRKYRIDFLGTATSSGTSAPQALWTGNIAENAWNDSDVSAADPADPITNGGLVMSTSVTYDTNDDGFFNDPTSANFDPGFPADEAYSVLLYVGYYQTEVADPCPAPPDFQDDNILDVFDVFAFLGLFNAMDSQADINNDGVFDIFDVFAFLALFNAGCP